MNEMNKGILLIIVIFIVIVLCGCQEKEIQEDTQDSRPTPILAYGEEYIYTAIFDNNIFNFSEYVDDFDRIHTEKEICRQVTFTNFNSSNQRIYIRLTIPDSLGTYSKIRVRLEPDEVIYAWEDVTEERWIPLKANSNRTLVIYYKMERSPIGTVIDNYRYECFLRCTIEHNYELKYWDCDVPFEVWT